MAALEGSTALSMYFATTIAMAEHLAREEGIDYGTLSDEGRALWLKAAGQKTADITLKLPPEVVLGDIETLTRAVRAGLMLIPPDGSTVH